ncbi:MAG: nitronate monooxygenase [Deltaproteobacteria bacterium]|nr:nitronate monooxygenase [Deltaproteobacteria bacterium]
MKDISELLGCKYPIIQGAMGVICNPEFVAAVSEAGGYGLLATAFEKDPGKLKARVDAVKALTDKPFGANLMPFHPKAFEFADILVEAGVKAVTTSGGSPKELLPYLKERNIKVLHVVSNVPNAVKAASAGVDAIIAEGSESGGMQGFNGASTMVLVPLVVDAVNVPVVAAGGIGDSRGYKAAFDLGAVGVQVGTAFIAAEECIAHANYKNALVSSREGDTRLINSKWAQFRVIATPMAEKMMEKGGFSKAEFSAQEASMEAAWIQGDLDAGIIAAGQITGMIKAVRPVREIIEEMVS